MWTSTNSAKNCATCANWGGPRKAVGPHTVEVPSCNERAECYAGVFYSSIPGPSACDGTTCPQYSLWPKIR